MRAAAAAFVVILSPNPAHLGQLVRAHVQGPAPAAVNFAPFAVRTHDGSDYVLQCLDPVCVPGPGAVVVAPRRLHAVVLPRATAAQVSRPLRSFRRQTAVSAPSYRIAPSTLRVLTLVLAALAVAIAAALAWPLARGLVPRRVDRRSRLERALALVRASLRRDADDRRRALDVLGRVLRHGPLRDEVLALAWSGPEPEPARMQSLIERAEGAG